VNSFVEDLGRFQTASSKMLSVVAEARRVATTTNPVLILGEEGSGRRELALEIFERSRGRTNQLVRWSAENFTALPLFASETILVENIERLDLAQQQSLLGIVSNSIGGANTKYHSSGPRWIATGDRSLISRVRNESFLVRLYQIFSVQTLHVPSLQERSEDIVDLSQRFVSELNLATGQHKTLSQDAIQRIQNLEFARNVQELNDLIERSYQNSMGTEITEESLGLEFKSHDLRESQVKAGVKLSEMERLLILQTLEMTKQNRTRAAEILGISIRTLRNKLNEYRGEGTL
jgi:two-component system, NtrC family, response regulator AtoC